MRVVLHLVGKKRFHGSGEGVREGSGGEYDHNVLYINTILSKQIIFKK